MTSMETPVALIRSRHDEVEEVVELEWREGSAYKGKGNALITTSNFSSATYRIEAYHRLRIHTPRDETLQTPDPPFVSSDTVTFRG
jgi:hypothetical protein